MNPSAPATRSAWPARLFVLYLAWWSVLAIAPSYREDWLLENVLVFVALPLLVLGWRRAPFSDGAYLALFAFFALHAVGALYTYAEVPYDAWSRRLFGASVGEWLGFERNHFDRFVHFLYGLLVTPAALQWMRRSVVMRGWWTWGLPFLFMASHGAIYETIEWIAAEVFGGELGVAYLGTQGDPFDAQKDAALAALGAALALCTLHVAERRRRA